MKNALILLSCLAASFLINGCVFAQSIESHPWTVTLKVIDDDGTSVSGADAWVAYHVPPPPDQNLDYGESARKIKGLTDTNGVFIASHVDDSLTLGIHVEKSGFYSIFLSRPLYSPGQFDEQTLNANWHQALTVVLKKISKPIPMYAKKNLKDVPVFNQPVGYDLMIGDWLSPYGKGIAKDVIISKEYSEKAPNDYYSKITISFPKPGDGIQVIEVPDSESGSGLRSPHEASPSGYQSELIREISAHPGQPNKFEYDPNRIYLFRVRTALDHQGNVVSAHYGKIYGDFMQFSYYLNPTPNDRNIEFDPKQNLLSGLQSFEQVNSP